MDAKTNSAGSELWTDAPEVFPNRKAVARFVSDRFERSLRSVERDLATKRKGERLQPKCFPRPDGRGYDLQEIQRYTVAEALQPRPEYAGGEEKLAAANVAELKRRKLSEETGRIKAQRERHELELAVARGDLVPRESRDRMLAQRLRILKQGLRIELKQAAQDLLQAAGGDPDLLPEFRNKCVELAEQIFSKWYAVGIEHDANISIDTEGTDHDQAQNLE